MQVNVPGYLHSQGFYHFLAVEFFLGNEEVSSSALMGTSGWVLVVSWFEFVGLQVMELPSADAVTYDPEEVVKSLKILGLGYFETAWS